MLDLSGLPLEPFGLDINRAAIAEAKAIVFPDRAACFVHADLREGIPFPPEFATVVANPLYADPGYYEQVNGKIRKLHLDGAVESLISSCWRALAPGGKLILWCYDGHVTEIARDYDALMAVMTSTRINLRELDSGPIRFWLSDRKRLMNQLP